MPANAQVYATSTIVTAATVTDVPIVVATIGPVAINNYGSNIRLECMVAFTPGADTSAVVLELRRNSATGTQIGVDATFPAAATVPDIYNASGQANEPVGNHTYSVVLTATDGSAPGTVTAVVLTATVGN